MKNTQKAMNGLVGRVALVAAAICAVASLPSFAGKTLTWNGEDGASWTMGENWLDGETLSAWVDGANAVFPSAATVTLDGKVTVSNLTAEGTLTVNGAAAASYADFLTENDALVFPGLKLADITAIDGTMAGGNFGAIPRVPAYTYHYIYSGKAGTAEFQCYYYTDLRCVKIELKEEDDGVHVKGLHPTGYVPGYAEKGASLGDFTDEMRGMLWNQKVATSDIASGYGVCELHASTAGLRMTGEAAFGGAFSVSNAAVEVNTPIAQTWGNAITFKNTSFTVRGLSDATMNRVFGITNSSVSGADAQWMSKTAGATVLTNVVLSRTTPESAVMRGTAIGYNASASVYHLKFDGETMTFQLQFYSSGVKGALVELKQSDANVTARWVKGWWWAQAKGGTADMVGCDLVAKQAELGTSVIENNGGSYGVKSLTLRTVEVPALSLGGSNSYQGIVADNAHIVYSSQPARPAKRLVARNDAQVTVTGGAGGGYGSGRTYLFEEGAVFMPIENMVSDERAHYVLDGAKIRTPLLHGTVKDGRNYFNHITLRNGAMALGNPLRCGIGGSGGNTMTYTSDGTSANVISSGVALVNHRAGTSGSYFPDMDNPNTLVLNTVTDLEITGELRDYKDPNYYGSSIRKTGAATLTLSGTNDYHGKLTVEAGTLALGSDTALPASAPLTLAGGTVTCGSTTNATGVLTLSGNVAINLEGGSLAFADSSGATWTAGAALTITGNDKLPTRSLRFGTSENGLTAAQLRQITYNGERVSLDSSGYLRHRGGFMVIVR